MTPEGLRVVKEKLRQRNDELLAVREALEGQLRRYQELFEFAPDGYVVTDAAGIILEANRAAATLLQVRQDFLVEKPLALYVAAQDRRAFRKEVAQLHLGHVERVLARQLMMRPRNGPSFHAELTIVGVRDSKG